MPVEQQQSTCRGNMDIHIDNTGTQLHTETLGVEDGVAIKITKPGPVGVQFIGGSTCVGSVERSVNGVDDWRVTADVGLNILDNKVYILTDHCMMWIRVHIIANTVTYKINV